MLPNDQNTKPAHTISAGGERYISLQDALDIYGVSRRTLYNWMDNGHVQWAYSQSGCRYLLLSSLALRSPNGETRQLDVPPSRYRFLDVR